MKRILLALVLAFGVAATLPAESMPDWAVGLQNSINSLSDVTGAIQTMLDNSISDNASAHANFDSLINTLSVSVEAQNDTISSTFNEIKQDMVSMDADISALQETQSDYNSFKQSAVTSSNFKDHLGSSLSDYAKKSDLSDYAKKSDLNDYMKSSEADSKIEQKVNSSIQESQNALKSEMQEALAQKADKSVTDSYGSSIGALEQKMAAREEKDGEQDTAIETAQTTADEAQTTADEAYTYAEDLQAQFDEAFGMIEENASLIDAQQAQIESHETSMSETAGRLDQVEADNETQQTTLDEHQTQIDAINDKLDNFDEDMNLVVWEGEGTYSAFDADGLPTFNPSDAWGGDGVAVSDDGTALDVKVTESVAGNLGSNLDGTATGNNVWPNVAVIDANGHVRKGSIGSVSAAADGTTIESTKEGNEQNKTLKVKTSGIVDGTTLQLTGRKAHVVPGALCDNTTIGTDNNGKLCVKKDAVSYTYPWDFGDGSFKNAYVLYGGRSVSASGTNIGNNTDADYYVKVTVSGDTATAVVTTSSTKPSNGWAVFVGHVKNGVLTSGIKTTPAFLVYE